MQFSKTRRLLPLFFLCFALGLTACETDTTDDPAYPTDEELGTETEGLTTDTMDPATSVQEIQGDANQYVGQRVRVNGEIEEVYGQNAFSIGGGLLTSSLLVVAPASMSSQMAMYAEDDEVEVTGTVQQYMSAEMDTEYGLTGVTHGLEEGDAVLVAEQVMQGAGATGTTPGMVPGTAPGTTTPGTDLDADGTDLDADGTM